MNIFHVDNDPVVAAQSLCDKHIPKMVLESTQLLSNALPKSCAPYRRVHEKHPCSIWVKESRENFNWLLEHSLALSEEYTFRFGKQHACDSVLQSIAICSQAVAMLENGLTQFPVTVKQHIYPELLDVTDHVLMYRFYYFFDKKRFAKWNRNRNPPLWWVEMENVS